MKYRIEVLIMRRREFIHVAAAAAGVTRLSAAGDLARIAADFGPCPRTIEEFLKYIVQRRAAEGLNGIIAGEGDPRYGKGHGKRKCSWARFMAALLRMRILPGLRRPLIVIPAGRARCG